MSPIKQVAVEDEYKKYSQLSKDDVNVLMAWMDKQPHLPKATELQIIFILHSCKYRLEATKTTIENYFTLRTHYSDIFAFDNVSDLKQALSVGSVNVLPNPTPSGHHIILTRLLDFKPENYVHLHQIILTDMVPLLHLFKHGISDGYHIVIDMQGSVFGHMTRCNLSALKKQFHFVQEGLAARIVGIHLINISSFIDSLMNMVRPFIAKELMDMIHIHSTMKSFFEHVPQNLLPADYGGQAPSISALHEETSRELLDNLEFFKWIQSQTVDESKRLEKNKLGQTFGVDGTFKKLQFD